MTRRCSFTSHSCMSLVIAPFTGGKSPTCSPWKRTLSALVGTRTWKAFRSDDTSLQFHFPFLHVVGDSAFHRRQVTDLLALETDALGIGGDKDMEGFQARVLDLILQVGGDLHQGFVDGRMLQAGDLDPRVHGGVVVLGG